MSDELLMSTRVYRSLQRSTVRSLRRAGFTARAVGALALLVLAACSASAPSAGDGGGRDAGPVPEPRLYFTACVLPGQADGGADCTAIDEPHIFFDSVPSGTCRTALLHVENRGDAALAVEAPTLSGSGAADFAFEGAPPAAFTLAPRADGSFARQSWRLRYCPRAPVRSQASLAFSSNDPTTPLVEVALDGSAQ